MDRPRPADETYATTAATDISDPSEDSSLGVDVVGAAADAAAEQSTYASNGRFRGQRLEITAADLTMFSAITGHTPSREERERALTWAEDDAGLLPGTVAKVTLSETGSSSVVLAGRHRPWLPSVLSVRVREIWFNGLSIRVRRPQITGWLKRFSTALQQGRKRVQRTGPKAA
jgi:hypothetical protein